MLKLETKTEIKSQLRILEPQIWQTYQPNWAVMEKLATKFSFTKNIVLVGNGGSINTFRGICEALQPMHAPNVYLVDTNEPSYLLQVAEKIDLQNSLLISISKSGENTSEVEATLFFLPKIKHKIFITGKHGVLREIADKDKAIEVVEHPEIFGRFAGLTEVGLLPALLVGLPAHELMANLNEPNHLEMARKLAAFVVEQESAGVTDLFVFNYSKKLSGFAEMVEQLIHETWGKDNDGLTVNFLDAPEAQHHTAQRILGGHKNTCLVCVVSDQSKLPLDIDPQFLGASIRAGSLKEFAKQDLAKSFKAEYQAMVQASAAKGVKNATLQTSLVDAKTVGEFINFWQMVAFEGAILRNVNPYDQPEVEAIKNDSYKLRFQG